MNIDQRLDNKAREFPSGHTSITVQICIYPVVGIAEITTESTTEKQEQTADGNNRRTNKTQATKPTKPVSEESEQQTGLY